MTYETLEKCVKQEFEGYAKAENIPLDNNIITDFLRYGFNDGAVCMCSNQADMFVAKMLENKKANTSRQKELLKRKAERLENIIYNRNYCDCRFSIMFIIQHFESLAEYGYFKDNVKSMFGFDLGKNPLDLKQKIINFALLDKTISKFDLEML